MQVDSAAIRAYIDQQTQEKMKVLQNDINDMVDNFQLEVVRQFQIQSGTI